MKIDDTGVPFRASVVVLFLVGLYVLVINPASSYGWLFLVAFSAAFALYFWELNRFRRRASERQKETVRKEPRLEGEPVLCQSGLLPQQSEFEVLDVETGDSLGYLKESYLNELIKAHEDWCLDTNDFYIMAESIEILEKDIRASPGLIRFLRDAMGERDDMLIRWVVK